MATYQKPLKSIQITTIGGFTVSAADTVEKPIATVALGEFEAFSTMHIETGENELTLIPFHAVDHIVVIPSSEEIEKPDPYHCES